MVGVRLVALLVLMAVSVWAPGLLVVRRWRWRADERACMAVAVSLFMLYGGALGACALGLGGWAYWVMAGGCAVAAAWTWRDAVGLVRLGAVRRVVVFYVVMAGWSLVCAGLIRHYSGGLWAGDWMLHFRKVGILLQGAPADVGVARATFLDRPPMANAVAAAWLGVVGYRFETFQLAFTLMNMLAVVPCCLFATRFVRRGGRRLWVLGALLVCLPMLWANATYTWTKLSATFYALLGMWLYLRAVEKGDRGRLLGAVGCFAAGSVAHYVAMPYAALTLGHYLVFVWRGRRGKWGELGLAAVCWVGVLGTWYGWVVARYGVGNLLGANPTLKEGVREGAGELLMKMGRNVVWTVVPHPLRMSGGVYHQRDAWGYVRDYVFLIYQPNVVAICGSVGGVVAAWLVWRALRPRGREGVGRWVAAAVGGVGLLGLAYLPGSRDVLFDLFPRMVLFGAAVAGGAWLAGVLWGMGREWWRGGASAEVWFWRGVVLLMPVLAGVVHDFPSDYGVGQIYFHPWALLGVTLVAVRVPEMPRWVRWALAGGMAVDFALGVWLHLGLERRVFEVLPGGGVDPGGMALQAALNWQEKVAAGCVYLGDYVSRGGAWVLEGVLVVGAVWAVTYVARGGGGENLDRGGGGGRISGRQLKRFLIKSG